MLRKDGLFQLCTGLAIAFCAVAMAQAADWPQFLGPDRNAVAPDAKGLPRSWPEGGPKVLWRVPTGEGFGGVCVYDDSVLLLDRKVGEEDIVRRLRLADGEEIWRSPFNAPGKLGHQGSRSTPATDGDRVFSIGPHGHIRAVKFSDGSVVWSAHLLDDWGAKKPNWGVATSPLLLDDKVIVSPWGGKAALVAYSKADGEVVWQTPNAAGTALAYTSPVLMEFGGKTMVVATGNGSHAIGVDSETGKQLWSYNGYRCKIQIASPVVLNDGRVLLTGGYGAGSAMFKVQAQQEDGFKVTELWKREAFGSTISQAVIHDGHIYLNRGFKQSLHGLVCATVAGELKWETGNTPTFDMGSILLADGVIFAVNGASGDLAMIEPDPTGYKELARARVLGGQKIWAPMALSNGKLLLRDHTTLVCIALTD